MRISEGLTPWREQEFGDARGTWRVGDLHDYADARAAPRPIPIRLLAPNNLDDDEEAGTDEFQIRAQASDIETPIIAIRYPDGLWIADGVHRTWTARELGRRSIMGWILDWEEILDVPHGRPSPESATSPY